MTETPHHADVPATVRVAIVIIVHAHDTAGPPRPALSRRLLRLGWRILGPTLFLTTHRDVIAQYVEHLMRSLGH
ncbi:hypothetical protein ACWDUH_04955 [Micromonospora wenchangensis]